MKVAFLFAPLALAAAWIGAEPSALTRGEVALGEKLRLGSIHIRPIEVIEDSRCPENVTCGTLNRILVRTEVRGPGLSKVRDFTIGEIRLVGGGAGLTLASVNPSPENGVEIASADYRFTYELAR